MVCSFNSNVLSSIDYVYYIKYFGVLKNHGIEVIHLCIVNRPFSVLGQRRHINQCVSKMAVKGAQMCSEARVVRKGTVNHED
jgi:hypothetical protein